MKKKLEDCLNDCLERLAAGRSLEECLAAYPELAGELEPLLRQALPWLRGPSPSPQFRASLRQRLLEAWPAPRRRAWSVRAFLPFRRWAVALSLMLALLLGGVGTAWAASSSVPGDLLYPVKMASEKAKGAMTLTQRGKANLQVRLAGERVREMAALAERGQAQNLEKLQNRLEAHLEKVETSVLKEDVEARDKLRHRLEAEAARYLPRFQKALERLPAARQATPQAHWERAQRRFQRVKESLTDPPPPPPGPRLPPRWRTSPRGGFPSPSPTPTPDY